MATWVERLKHGDAIAAAKALDLFVRQADTPENAERIRKLLWIMFAGRVYTEQDTFFTAVQDADRDTLINQVKENIGGITREQIENLIPQHLRDIPTLRVATFEESIIAMEATRVYLRSAAQRTKLSETYAKPLLGGQSLEVAMPYGLSNNIAFVGWVQLDILNNFVAHCLAIKSALVSMKTPKQLLELAETHLSDLFKSLGSQLNPARMSDITRYLFEDVEFYSDEERQRKQSDQIVKSRDNMTQIRIGLMEHRLDRYYGVPWETPDEVLDNGDYPLDPSRGVCKVLTFVDVVQNYYRARQSAARNNGQVRLADTRGRNNEIRIYKILSLWQLHAYYIRNDLRLMDLNEFAWVAMVIETMADTLTKAGPIPTDIPDFIARNQPQPGTIVPAWAQQDEYALVNGLEDNPWLQHIWFHPIERDQNGNRFPLQRASARVYQRIALSMIGIAREAADKDTMRGLARDKFANRSLSRSDLLPLLSRTFLRNDPFVLDPVTRRALDIPPGMTSDDFRNIVPRMHLNQGRERLLSNWFRRVDYLLLLLIAEKANIKGGFWSVKWSDFIDILKLGFGFGYDSPEESLMLLEQIGTLCLLIGIYDDLVRGVTEEHMYLPTNADLEHEQEMLIKALGARKTMIGLVESKHLSEIGYIGYDRKKTRQLTKRLAALPGYTRAQLATPEQFINVPCGIFSADLRRGNRLVAGVLGEMVEGDEKRSEVVAFHTESHMYGALLGWIFMTTYNVFNYDMFFNNYYREMQEMGIYYPDVSFEEYMSTHYKPRLDAIRKVKGKEAVDPRFDRENWARLPLPIWEWLFVATLRGIRPVLVPECSELRNYIDGIL